MDRPADVPHLGAGRAQLVHYYGAYSNAHRGAATGRSLRTPEVRNRLAQGAPEVVGPAHPPRLRGRPPALQERSADVRRRIRYSGAGHLVSGPMGQRFIAVLNSF